jgi:hypothetical protein
LTRKMKIPFLPLQTFGTEKHKNRSFPTNGMSWISL